MTDRWRIITGDALEIMREMEPESVDAIVTDPPYASTGDTAIASSRARRVPPETQFFAAWLREYVAQWRRVVSPRGAIWLTLDWRGCMVLDEVSARFGFDRPPAIGVWDKERIGMGGIMRRSFETFAVLMRNDFVPFSRSERDVWRHAWGGGATGLDHPAEKPIVLLERALALVAPAGALILDPFMGSGSTGVATLRTGRRFIGIERDEGYCAVARERLEAEAAQSKLALPEAPRERIAGPLFAEGEP